ncbi:uncharacterized protein LOC126748184 isoform X2 [Anthonomus grandis grandis]|uniref:uncharacterized protein LOC126748184 isoform X2 n=1 Tax=Anthonomus grandis grandis TaxID=2921223 RepID=UPI002165ED08|nr:uncharacterized protein LOC126748184 isoform X2 [Anthonomus grandis grandis]
MDVILLAAYRIDPGKMDKIQKTQPFENTASSIQNQDISHNETVSQQLHQHSSTNHFYPMIHQHAQAYNKGYGQPMQAPLLLNISNQHIIQTTAHRHFQYYPQYGVNINQNDFPHQHIPRHVNHQPQSNISNPTPPPVPAISSSNVQAPSHDEHVQKVAPAEVLKQEPSKEGSAKKLTPAKVKPKEGDKIQLRSPPAKRPPNSPVTMQGWLHKQGSEGLMLWKKRWFVLSEYCLFYYKGLQEDKVLGSILLPSYKVSICGPEDKVNRKFAFKCEHANMRTYILAADSQELMNKWVHVLSMACNLQSNIEPPKDQKIPQNNTSEPNSFKSNTPSGQSSSTYGNQLNTSARSNPIHHHTPSNTTDLSNSSQQELNQYNQPLYANAPPKPRRMTDGYCSPGPEILERYPSYQMSHSGAKSPVDMYGRHVIKPPEQIYNERIFLGPPNVDRRTPDTYARSNMSKYRNPTDYEDIYTDHGIYKRPLSPVAPDSMLKKGYPTVNVGYPAVKGYAPPPLELLRPQYPEPVLMRKSMAQTISRPHSADFLEYKPQKLESNPSATPVSQHSRPKSSLDINMYSKDCDTASRSNYFLNTVDRHNDKDYFYSQEKYAEKMRKSAQYLQKMPVKYQPVDPSQRKYREKYELEIANTYAYSQPFRDQQVPNLQPVRSRSALSEGSLLCAQDVEDDSISREYPLRHEHDLHLSNRNLAQDQFTRSASARLTQSGTFEETVTTRMEGERKREESMKRLLEWKQRMLQSPLNRKAQAQATRGYPVGKENSYSSYQSFASGDKKQKKSTITNRRSVHNLVQYTSYSSDDEENGEKSSKHTQQAGRTVDTFPNISDSHTHASFTSTTALNLPDEPATSATSLLTNHSDAPSPSSDSILAHLSVPEEFTDSNITSDIKANGALVKAILSEFQMPDPKEAIMEGNYMPMSPKKNLLSSKSDANSENTIIFNDTEENLYVEMTRAVGKGFLESNNCEQQYEMVCFNGTKAEPVYMEVPGMQFEESTEQENEELPDILKNRTKDEKTDSSDADDEASKDLGSLENPAHPRFSLSDTFRPASYYLGVTKNVPEFQDSSDSELVSPPPIPESSPPLDDDDYIPHLRKKDKGMNSSTPKRNSDQYFNRNQNDPRTGIDGRTSFLSLKDLKDHDISAFGFANLEINDSLSHLSSNSGSLASLTPNSRRPISEEFSTPTEYGQIQNLQSVENYFAGLKMSEDVLLAQRENANENGHAYENYMLPQRKPMENLSSLTNSPRKKSLPSPTSIDDLRPRCRPESSCSVSAEISSFFGNSNRSTPVISSVDFSGSQIELPHVVPYYYSDLSENLSNLETSLTLNNQRESINGSKKDITHIINPIKCSRRDEEDSFSKDAAPSTLAEARSVSMDFLNLTDKSDNIDKKNIYESDTLKRRKEGDGIDNDPKSRNFYPKIKPDKFDENIKGEKIVRKSYSLEGLLENVLNENIASETNRDRETVDNLGTEGSYLWEEDSVWREQLRSVSQRHTKSMDDLDSIDVDNESALQKKPARPLTREVTYVNDILFKSNESTKKSGKSSKIEIKKKGSFLIDRETLRQWDLMSSAPSDDQISKVVDAQGSQVHAVVDSGEGSTDTGENGNNPETASGSISINTRDSTLGRDTFPRGMTPKRSETPNSQNVQSRSTTNLDKSTIRSYDKNIANYPSQWINQSNQQICDREQDFRASQNDITSKSNVSAGELLERTHEELVLLLIQLRRQQAQTFQAIESCYNEIDSLQIHMHNMDQVKRMENLQKLERIKQNLLELEKQYEKRKPLVNLVDNMVKLGSLYRNSNERPDTSRHLRERLEFNQHIQERRLLAEERRDWNRIEPSHIQLQEKVRQLYQLDSLIQEESRNLHNLQRDKGDIERALGGLRNKLQKGLNTPEEIDQARRQQYILENELSRVHLMLAHNSKKLEETVAGNARLEQELLVLKQKLQASRQQRSSPQFSNAGDSLPYFTGSSQVLESDLEKVQKKIGDLQKQRDELSLQVRQLTDRSNTPHLQQAKISFSSDSQCNNANKKKPISSWRETDLDTMNSIDHGYDSYSSTSTTPLFINTDMKLYSGDAHDRSMKTSDSTSDDTALSSNPLEKPEIKTVRIVKRESERRQRDREKTFNGKCDPLVEEDSSEGSSVLFRPTSLPQKLPVSYEHNSLPSRGTRNKAAELSPVFKSEAARQIITEMSTKSKSPSAQNQRRAIPKERRRHHTAPHDNLVFLGNLEGRRARDDLDIERALRQRIDAPDLVRSTLSNKELKYNEETIDSILSTPNKILIPERYIPEQLPQPNTSRESKRKKKVESIKKMLSDTAIISAPTTSSAHTDEQSLDKKPSPSGKFQSAPTISEEKKQREHLLQLNQILAKQVMEMSKVVAVKNLTALKLNPQPVSTEEDDSSPIAPLPLYQQRENFYS